MGILLTFLIGILGGGIAFYFQLPLPWLLGSLLAVVLLKKASFVEPLPKKFSRWMRVILGVALGGSVADSLSGFNSSLMVSVFSAIFFVSSITLFGFFYFRRLTGFSSLDSFMSALPGGLTFLMSMSENLGSRFPKIALIHTTRMVMLVFTFSIFAYFFEGSEIEPQKTLGMAVDFPLNIELWKIILIAVLSKSFADMWKISGGDIMFPMILSAIFYSQGFVQIPMPELLKTLAMIVFGVTIGCKIVSAPLKDSASQVKASLIFTFIALLFALLISISLSEVFDKHYLLFFFGFGAGKYS